MFLTKKIQQLSRPALRGCLRFCLLGIFGIALLAPPAARAEGVLNWEMGPAIPLGNLTIPSIYAYAYTGGRNLTPDAPAYFQTMVAGGYRFHLTRWFFIAPMGYYRLTAGQLNYRDINFGYNYKTDYNLIYQRDIIGNELAVGADMGFLIGKWTITPAIYIGARNMLQHTTLRYFSDYKEYQNGPWFSQFQFVITPRLSFDYVIAPSVDMGLSTDYNFTPGNNKNDLVNISLRALFHF